MIDFFSKLSNWAQIASILSLIITLILLCNVKKIKKEFNKFISFKTRIPDLRSELENASSSIIKLMNEYPDSVREIQMELCKTSATLKSLKNKVPDESKKTIIALLKSVIKETQNVEMNGILKFFKRNKKYTLREDKIYEIQGSIGALIVEIKHLEKDRNWRFIDE